MKIKALIIPALALVAATGCKKTVTPSTDIDPKVERREVLTQMAENVIYTTYTDMSVKAGILSANVAAFNASGSAADQLKCQSSWKEVRSAWEQSEGFLFGPVSSDDIDPRIDTWPIDFARMDSVLASSAVFTSSYIDGLEESLKGFHPIEYLLFGANGNKAPGDFTNRQKDLLAALTLNLKSLCDQVKNSWDPSNADNYTNKFVTAGYGSNQYETQRAAYEEVVDAMAGICDEVANGKIKEPFDAMDPTKEESPFAKNSIADFTNNIKSVQNLYLGKYNADGKGLEDLIKSNNAAMDGAIKTKIASAITSLNNISMPFGQAIMTSNGQRTQVQNAINAIEDLHVYLESDVKAYVQILTNN